ncbi:NYN domain-containing protein [Sphaerisporangium dianthi]|uniref:NYN domain-containing protein n=1 Tax=Sphaerisporangium dianthi TaxID=1436120 RepID=A0ABV9C917_9ACTN
MITPVAHLDEFQARRSQTSRRSRSAGHQESLRHGRAMHLLDIENLVGTSGPTTREVEEVMMMYDAVVPIGERDHYMVAVNPAALVAVGVAFPGGRLLTRPGPDGADRALGEAAYHDRIDLRFERVVIGSGDGYFVDLAHWLREAGLHVIVVSRPGSLSRRLSAAATEAICLEPATQHAA